MSVVQGESGPPVLLVMGFAMTGAMWGPVVEQLSSDHRCATYDHPGLVEDSLVEAVAVPHQVSLPRTIGELAEAASTVLDELGWERAHIVGVSMGGMVAQELAIRSPERVTSLSLLATHAGGPGAALPTWKGLLVMGMPRSRGWKLQRLLYPRAWRRQEEALLEQRTAAQLGQRLSPEGVRAQLRAVVGHDTRDRLGSIRAPTLVVEAAQDRLVRSSRTRALAAAIPGARYVRLPDAGHGLVVQEAALLGRLLREHMAQSR